MDARNDAWKNRKLLREIYHRYFQEMIDNFARLPDRSTGRVLEIGGGSGNFKAYFPHCISSDIVPTRLVDLALDATLLPFPDNSLDNIVMQDVLHHVPYPLAFFAEAQRALRPGGRIVMTEPYASPLFRLACKMGHPEPVDKRVELFPDSPQKPDPVAFKGEGAFASNQAIPTVLFYRDLKKFQTRFPRLRIAKRFRRSRFVYPLSGGFSGKQLLPNFLTPPAWFVEHCLAPLSPLMAFRLVVVVEKIG